MSFLKPISDLAMTATNDGTMNLRQTYELAARMIESAANRQANLLKKDWADLYEATVTPQTALSKETWEKLSQMSESFWEVSSAGVTSLNGDGSNLKRCFYDYVFKTFETAVAASGDPAREVYGLTNRLINVLKFMDMSEEAFARFCDTVERVDPHAKDPENSALQKFVTYWLQYRSMGGLQYKLGAALAYRIQEAKGLVLPEAIYRQQKPTRQDLLPSWQFTH